MKEEFILQGLSCASCAAKIEHAIQQAEGITSSSMNITTSKLRVETSDTYDINIFDLVQNIVHTYEPDVTVIEVSNTKIQEEYNEQQSTIRWLILGTALYIVGLCFEYILHFNVSTYVALVLFACSYIILGGKVLLKMLRNISKGQVFDENFLMGFATIGAIIIGKPAEAVTVMLFYQIGEFFQDMAVSKSKKQIGELMNIRPDYANVMRGGQLLKVNPEQVQIGDVFVVKPGEKIPLDGIVMEGEAMLDTTALTGESVPRKATILESVISGCINLNGVLTIQATQTYGESTVSKILDLVEHAAHKKAPTETFITKFARYYTPIVVCSAVLLAIVPPLLFGGVWMDWISRALIFLVISCPCALVVSIPLGFFGGIGAASKHGILVKGGNYLEALANLDVVVFDKTGTLTKGVFQVTSIQPTQGFNTDLLLELAAYAEDYSTHPIALSIQKEYGMDIDQDQIKQYEELAGMGVSVCIKGQSILLGNEKLMKQEGIEYTPSSTIGTTVYIAIDQIYAGCIVISDEVKSDSREAIASLKALGVQKTVMLTGDTRQIAEGIADELKLDEVYANLLPGQKVEQVERLKKDKRAKRTIAFVGDGINDAPVLAMADVGIAMGALGSDAAIEAADVVLMTDEPSKLAEAVTLARFTKRIVWQNIIMALGIKFLFLFLATLGVSSLWEAVFADVGVSLLAVLNSMRVLKVE